MASTIEGYQYDIFVSYRHNDNLPSQNGAEGWVTEFVDSLRAELAATIKQPLSVYFDKNPYDGLLETHNVDKSLEGKLKCLIFIPVISQTYCDTKSFAWQHELQAFNRLAQGDSIGRDIKLTNGNVASRILPVKIHDLDAADRVQLEHELGGPLRAIEFIYKEPGVNRPLSPADKKEENQLKTSYRNQVNKVANAVKEILYGMERKELVPEPRGDSPSIRPTKPWKKAAAAIGLPAVLVFTYLWFFPRQTVQTGPNTILVLPFESDSLDKDQSYFAKGITSDIIIEIGKARNLNPLSWHTSFEYADTKKSLREVAEETNAKYILSGGVQRVANQLRLYVELADPADNRTIWSNRYDRELQQVLDVQKEIAISVAEALDVRLSDSERKNIGRFKTKSFEAYDLFLQAEVISRTLQLDLSQFEKSQSLIEKAILIDPDFAEAYFLYAHNLISIATYGDLDPVSMAKKAEAAVLKAIELDPTLPDGYIILGSVNFFLKWDFAEAARNFEKGWAMTNQGSTAIYHCLCAYSEFKLVKGNYRGVLNFVDSVRRNDPRYPYADVEKFLAYYGLRDLQGMSTIRAAGRPEFVIPAYDYYLGDFMNSARGFKPEAPFLILAHAGSAYYKANLKTKSDSILAKVLQQPDTAPHKDMILALLYGARGDKKKSLEWYLKAYEGKDYIILYSRVIPDLEPILNEPEVKEIFEKIGL